MSVLSGEYAHRFPWRDGNGFRLLIDGDQFFPAMLRVIDEAREFIVLEMYLFESGVVATRFIDALLRATARGVRVFLLLDDFGARRLSRRDRARLSQDGMRVKYYNPLRYRKWRRNLLRDHRKLLVADGLVAFAGGAGITDAFAPTAGDAVYWRETMVEIRGPLVADWVTLFTETWRSVTGEAELNILPVAVPPADDQRGRVVFNHGPRHIEIKRSVLTRVRTARKRVWLATAYFVPSIKLRRALRRAAKRGVDVRLLLPGPYTDHPGVRHAGRRFYHRLLRDGIKIFEYQPRFSHSKVVVCDDWVSVGSSNMDRWNLRWNLEANQEVEGESFAAEVCAMLLADFRFSEEIRFEEWCARSWYRRLLERVWGRVDLWIERLTRRDIDSDRFR